MKSSLAELEAARSKQPGRRRRPTAELQAAQEQGQQPPTPSPSTKRRPAAA